MTERSYGVALFGPVFLDHIFTGFPVWPLPGQEVFADDYHREAGGGCFNTACGLTMLGCPSVCFAAVGESDGDWLLTRVSEFGVDTSEIRRSAKPSGVTVSVSMPDDRSFFTYDGANADLLPWLFEPALIGRLAAARHVHFAMAVPPDPGVQVVRALQARGCTVSLDVGWASGWFRESGSLELLRSVDLFLPNSAEAEAITGEKTWQRMLGWFQAMGLHRVALKMGPAGAALLSSGQFSRCEPVAVPQVDTTGAGDAFNAGFLQAFLEALPLNECLRRGVVCGSLSVRKPGSLSSFPSLHEVLQFS